MIWTNALTEYYNVQNGTSLVPVYYSDAGFSARQKDSSDATCGAAAVGSTAGDCDNPYVKTDGDGFRLPTMPEWELAARYKGSDSTNGAIEYPVSSADWWTPGSYASGAVADYNDAAATSFVSVYSTPSTAIVKSKTANALGLYDMSGNVVEWKFDWLQTFVGSLRKARGGGWDDGSAFSMQVGGGGGDNPFDEFRSYGFRLSRTP